MKFLQLKKEMKFSILNKKFDKKEMIDLNFCEIFDSREGVHETNQHSWHNYSLKKCDFLHVIKILIQLQQNSPRKGCKMNNFTLQMSNLRRPLYQSKYPSIFIFCKSINTTQNLYS